MFKDIILLFKILSLVNYYLLFYFYLKYLILINKLIFILLFITKLSQLEKLNFLNDGINPSKNVSFSKI